MREIKFRYYDIKRKLYAPVGDFHISDGGWTTFNTSKYGGYKGQSILVEQYTGMKDDSGKEIYEGDILEAIDPPGMENCITAVVWNQLEACFYVENDTIDVYEQIYNVTGYCTVIGNIHEHPEFLK